jgi:nitrate/nitrite transporter NarK
VLFFTVLNLRQIQGFTPRETGLRMLPPTVIITVLSAPSGSLTDRIGPRIQMILGPLTVAAGAFLLTVPGADSSYLSSFLPGLSLVGAGMALSIPALTKSALNVGPDMAGSASGLNNAVARMANLLAVAALGAVMVSLFSPALESRLKGTSLEKKSQLRIFKQSGRLGGISVPEDFTSEQRREAGEAVRSSFVYGYRRVVLICAALALAGSVSSALLIGNYGRAGPERTKKGNRSE